MRTLFVVLSLLLLVILALFYWFGGFNNFANKKNVLLLRGREFKIEVADNPVSRAQGLSYRESLAEDAGMLFLFDDYKSYGFWMKDMHFPIDIIWLKDNRIVGFKENALPQPEKGMLGLEQYYPPEPVNQVFEVNAGIVAKYGIEIGDVIEMK